MQSAFINLTLICLALWALAQGQQSKAASACPTIIVDCPSSAFQTDAPLKFTATVTGATEQLTYMWTVSTGTIRSGQGTPSIEIESAKPYNGVTATVTLSGLPPDCLASASCSFIVCPGPVAIKFDSYGKIRLVVERKRLDLFADELRVRPGVQGYIVVSPGRGDTELAALRRAARAQSYLVNTRGIEAGRVVMGAGAAGRALTVELYVVPSGATPPPMKAQ